VSRLFVPGFGAHPGFYRRALGARWAVHTPPTFRSGAGFADHVDSLRAALAPSAEPVTLAGHSLGAAVAVAATAERPECVARLLLLAPAGMPLTKPIRASVTDFARQLRRNVYPPRELLLAIADAAAAPRTFARLARAVRTLDLRHELEAVRASGVPCVVVSCHGDTLTPADHCRRIAQLAGAGVHEITARGGHMWLVVDPAAYAF
jgi:pimeloyl-ACP methyl ester carboxylesterase